MRGILLIAVGEYYYAKMGNAMAKSIKKHTDIPVSVITTEDLLSAFDGTLIDKFIFPVVNDYFEGYLLNPFKLKTNIYKYTPYEETLYLDVDGLCVKDITPIFEQVGEFQIQEVKRWQREYWDSISMIWLKNAGVTLEYFLGEYGLTDCVYPEYNSSFIYFTKSIENKRYFDKVAELYNDRRTVFQKIGKFYPDEMAFNLASCLMNHYGTMEQFKPILFHWETNRKEALPSLSEIVKNHYFIGMASGYHPVKLVRLYDALCKDYGIDLKFDNRKKIIHKK